MKQDPNRRISQRSQGDLHLLYKTGLQLENRNIILRISPSLYFLPSYRFTPSVLLVTSTLACCSVIPFMASIPTVGRSRCEACRRWFLLPLSNGMCDQCKALTDAEAHPGSADFAEIQVCHHSEFS